MGTSAPVKVIEMRKAIPARRLSSAFAMLACTRRVRLASSTRLSTAVICPVIGRPGAEIGAACWTSGAVSLVCTY